MSSEEIASLRERFSTDGNDKKRREEKEREFSSFIIKLLYPPFSSSTRPVTTSTSDSIAKS